MRRGDDGMDKPQFAEGFLRAIAIPLGLGAMTEIRKSPWTTVTALAALIIVIYQGVTHASQADVVDLRGQVATLGETLKEIRAAQVVGDIMQAREKACHATQTDQREYFQHQLNAALEKYYSLQQRSFQLPTCSEV